MLSIITVNYNTKKELIETIESIENQQVVGAIEVIVVDGNSNDGSQDVITKRFGNIVDVLISEKDTGIYDAMNKGIKAAKYEWIYFLNAGDCFASDSVLNTLLWVLKKEKNRNFIYAPYISDEVIDNSQELTIDYLSSHMINHQSIVFNRSLFDVHLYDTSYRFCADYAHLLMVLDIIKPLKIDCVIANFDSTGISSVVSNKKNMWKERLHAVWKSKLPLCDKLRLSRRAVIAYPYHLFRGLIN